VIPSRWIRKPAVKVVEGVIDSAAGLAAGVSRRIDDIVTHVPKGADLMDEVGQLGGELFPAEKIPALAKYLDRRGVFFHEGVNGSFDGVRGVVTLPRNPTKLNVRHELSHMLDYRKYGEV
jgi:hypothetical protein